MRHLSSTALLFLAFFLPAMIWRGWLLAGEPVLWAGPSVLGVAADLGVALVLTALAGTLLQIWEPLAVMLAVVHALMWWGNYEQIVALDGSLLLGYIDHMADPTFIAGSVLTLSQPWLGLGMLPIAAGLVIGALRRGESVNSWIALALGIPLVAYAVTAVPTSKAPLWAQENFLIINAETAVRKGPMNISAATFTADLDGPPGASLARPRPNVLLIVLEGYSGAYLAPVAAAHGRADVIATPHLDALAARSLTYTQFLANQRQTNRGLYALLCGDYPHLGNGPVHMDAVVALGKRRCLPAVLAENGYQTFFAQAAPLEFQGIGAFAKAVGFDEAVGGTWFKTAYARNEWGVDDHSFFTQGMTLVQEAEESGTPWFLTLVTSGTHHPFNTVPQDFPKRPGESDMERAVRFADHAVGQLLETLEQDDRLGNTLVLVTSDESLGLPRSPDGPLRWLAANWSFLTVQHPDLVPGIDSRPAMHADLAISLVDLLGLNDGTLRWGGRSLFRHYASPRDMAFANTYTRSVYGLRKDGSAWRCKEYFDRCVRWLPADGLLFAPTSTAQAPVPPADAQWLQAIAAYSRRRY